MKNTMKISTKITLICFLAFGFSQSSFAAATKKKAKQTDIQFDGSTVTGRYQTGNEGMVTVENEKVLSDLLKPPRDFKDRLAKENQPLAKDAKE